QLVFSIVRFGALKGCTKRWNKPKLMYGESHPSFLWPFLGAGTSPMDLPMNANHRLNWQNL
ncbi:MAG TPA: hypothetical protein DD706_15045, partial [Nitrospiraceae bacterium]|nr:hypothetical protein [Nitrospiraceae bacterium]